MHDRFPTTAKIVGLGSYLPERVVTNSDLETLVDTSDEWITTRTGIKERRVVALVRHDVDPVRFVGETRFLEHDARLHAVRRRRGEKLDPVGILGGPAREDRVIEGHALCSRLAC